MPLSARQFQAWKQWRRDLNDPFPPALRLNPREWLEWLEASKVRFEMNVGQSIFDSQTARNKNRPKSTNRGPGHDTPAVAVAQQSEACQYYQ